MPGWFVTILALALIGSVLAAIGFSIVRMLKRTE